jgi:hypothetical protein
MSNLLVALTVLSGLILLVGFAWIMLKTVRAQKPSVQELSDEEAARLMFPEDEDEPGEVSVLDAEKSLFKGKAVGASVENQVSFSQIEEMIRAGKWREALPWLLAIIGLLGIVVLIGPLIWFVVGNRLVAIFWMLATLWTLINLARNYIRGSAD